MVFPVTFLSCFNYTVLFPFSLYSSGLTFARIFSGKDIILAFWESSYELMGPVVVHVQRLISCIHIL
jgi:hypothetical protein